MYVVVDFFSVDVCPVGAVLVAVLLNEIIHLDKKKKKVSCLIISCLIHLIFLRVLKLN